MLIEKEKTKIETYQARAQLWMSPKPYSKDATIKPHTGETRQWDMKNGRGL